MAQGDILYRGASTWERLPAGNADNVLMTNGAAANPQWATWASLVYTSYALYADSDLAKTNDTTLAADPAFDITLKANHAYRLKYDIFWDTSAGPDLRCDFAFSGTTTSYLGRTLEVQGGFNTANLPTGSTAGAFTLSVATTIGLDSVFNTGGTVTPHRISTIAIETGASGGTFSLRWAQNTLSGTALTRRRNSSLFVTECT